MLPADARRHPHLACSPLKGPQCRRLVSARTVPARTAHLLIRLACLQVPPQPDNFQQSWLLAETFKYAWLLFGGKGQLGGLDLDQWVLTTEAHPLRMRPARRLAQRSRGATQ